ncbi:MAG: rRNA maturation RNase YbeY [Synergistaceae bacterium]|jgi:probable rRNA maturation factor|nr:rRNA maturation RNase YbeY [Synergistaceae bacterium]
MRFIIEPAGGEARDVPLDTGVLSREMEESLPALGDYGEVAVALTFVTDGEMKGLNERYRGIGESTDVLSFPLWEEDGRFVPPASWSELPLGDVVVSPDFVRANAEKEDIGYNIEMARIVIHGVLHLVGFGHDTDRRGDEMWGLQEEILGRYLVRMEQRGGLMAE